MTLASSPGLSTAGTANRLRSGGNYALGGNVTASASTYKNDVYQSGSSTATSYAWYEGAVQSSITTSSTATHTSTFVYDGSGSLSSIYVGDGRPRTVTFVNDANGQTIKRDESDYNPGGDPHGAARAEAHVRGT